MRFSSGGFTGGFTNEFNGYRTEIFEFNQETESWTEIGALKGPRCSHAVSAVSFNDYEKWCN